MRAKPQSPVPILEPLLVNTRTAAKLLGISAWEVRRLAKKGLLAYKKLSKTNWLYPMKSIRAFAEVPTKGGAA